MGDWDKELMVKMVNMATGLHLEGKFVYAAQVFETAISNSMFGVACTQTKDAIRKHIDEARNCLRELDGERAMNEYSLAISYLRTMGEEEKQKHM